MIFYKEKFTGKKPRRNKTRILISIIVSIFLISLLFFQFLVQITLDQFPWDHIDYDDIKNAHPEIANTQPWTLENHMAIAKAVHMLYWGEPLQEWDIGEIFVYRDCEDFDCEDNDDEFMHSRHHYHKREWFTEYSYTLNIWSDSDHVSIRVFEYPDQFYNFDLLFGIKRYEWDEIKVSPSQALDIAEENGGAEIRESMGASCNIYLHLASNDGEKNGWVITYAYGDRREKLLIDPTTGEVKRKSFE